MSTNIMKQIRSTFRAGTCDLTIEPESGSPSPCGLRSERAGVKEGL
jgi:hypothetical protein